MTTDGDATGSIEATTEYPSIGRFHSRQIVRYSNRQTVGIMPLLPRLLAPVIREA